MVEEIPEEERLQAATMREEPRTEPDGLERVFREQHRMVFQAAYRVTGNAMDAEDAMQTVFFRLLRREDGTAPGELSSSYLHLAAVNAALDILRHRTAARTTPLEDVGDRLADAAFVGQERRLASNEIGGIVRRALARLSPAMAEIFTLRYLEGHSNREIARILNRSVTFVAVSIHRARKRLREEIRSQLEGSHEAP